MVHELHKLGHQRLRISPGLAPDGCNWRCLVTHAANILRSHGAMVKDFNVDCATYSTGQSNNYFNWKDAHNDTARQLATKFIERFPAIVKKGEGIDWQYAGWYVQMLGYVDRCFAFPIAAGDYVDPNPRWFPTTGGIESSLPMPPGGEAEMIQEEQPEAVSILKRWAEPEPYPQVHPRQDGTFVVAHEDGEVEIVGPGHKNFDVLTEDLKRQLAEAEKNPDYFNPSGYFKP